MGGPGRCSWVQLGTHRETRVQVLRLEGGAFFLWDGGVTRERFFSAVLRLRLRAGLGGRGAGREGEAEKGGQQACGSVWGLGVWEGIGSRGGRKQEKCGGGEEEKPRKKRGPSGDVGGLEREGHARGTPFGSGDPLAARRVQRISNTLPAGRTDFSCV